MNTTAYVFVEKQEKYQQFSAEKKNIPGAMSYAFVWFYFP